MRKLGKLLAISMVILLFTSCKPYVIIIKEKDMESKAETISTGSVLHMVNTPGWGREVPKIIILNNKENGNKRKRTIES